MIVPSWLRRNKPLRVSEGSLRAIRRAQLDKALAEQAESAKARKLARFKLNS
jgi:flavin-dependent dehydrogenase